MEEQGGEDESATEFMREVCSILDAKKRIKVSLGKSRFWQLLVMQTKIPLWFLEYTIKQTFKSSIAS